jgi:hypothetical protein
VRCSHFLRRSRRRHRRRHRRRRARCRARPYPGTVLRESALRNSSDALKIPAASCASCLLRRGCCCEEVVSMAGVVLIVHQLYKAACCATATAADVSHLPATDKGSCVSSCGCCHDMARCLKLAMVNVDIPVVCSFRKSLVLLAGVSFFSSTVLSLKRSGSTILFFADWVSLLGEVCIRFVNLATNGTIHRQHGGAT